MMTYSIYVVDDEKTAKEGYILMDCRPNQNLL